MANFFGDIPHQFSQLFSIETCSLKMSAFYCMERNLNKKNFLIKDFSCLLKFPAWIGFSFPIQRRFPRDRQLFTDGFNPIGETYP